MGDYDFGVGPSQSTWYFTSKLWQFSLFHPICDRLSYKISDVHNCPNVQFKEMWANINYPGSKVSPHSHVGAKNSGVFYLQKPKNSGEFILDGKTIPIKQNELILFDSNIIHETEINNSKEKRVVIGFNYTVY